MKSMLLYQLLFLVMQHQLVSSASYFPASSSPNHLCPHEQSLALLHFKQTFTIDTSASASCDFVVQTSFPKTLSWNSSTDCCLWDGVTCDELTGQVIGLDLSCSQLQGSFNSNNTLFHLPHLQKLNLAFNDFFPSTIPRKIGTFATTLTHLNLSNCRFSGHIPTEISSLTKLFSLDLSHNDQGIKLGPNSFRLLIQNMTQLRVLSLAFVNISSVLPINVSSSFTSLDLSSTGLHGILPEKLFHLPNLEKLDLSVNKGLTGNFPEVDQKSSSPFRWLDLSITNLSGEVPRSIRYLKSLNYLSLSGCQFTGSIFESLENCTEMTHLDLSGNKFTGNIPSTLSNLDQLTHLVLTDNIFQGRVPNIFSKLKNLRTLLLRSNQLNGPFPSSVVNLTNLVELDFSYNSLTGSFPFYSTGLQNLTDILLLGNSLTGMLPSWFFALPSLVIIDLSFNQLYGPLGDFQSNSLEMIDLSRNHLHGPIPRSVSKVPNLSSLYLWGNNFSGVVELDMFTNLTNLQYLDLSYNSLTVSTTYRNLNATFNNLDTFRLAKCKLKEFPKFLKACKNLRLLDLSHNEIEGNIPNWMLSMWADSLSYLNISHNLLTGVNRLPWKNLGVLDLKSNLIQEPLTSTLCDLTLLEVLDMSNNSLGGGIPQCLRNLNRLMILNLQTNRLSGTIPEIFVKGNLLLNLDFNGNQLEGRLPRSLTTCNELQFLDLGNNQLNDTFPQWLETLPDLQVLVLRSNRLHGPIMRISTTSSPFAKLRVIDLSRNQFTGLLPATYINNFKGMMNLNNTTLQYMVKVHEYYYSMTVAVKGHDQIYDRILTAFTAIDLSSNKFEGGIPNAIGYLKSLKVLNLSHNSLTGQIPLLLGNLSEIESLDLSSNHLTGKIPQQLAGLNTLAILNISHNHLEGKIPRGPQFNTFDNDSYVGNSALCGFPLSKGCNGDEETPSAIHVEKEDDSDSESGFTWIPVVMGYSVGTAVGLVVGYLMLLTGKPKWLIGIVKAEERRILKRRILKRRNRHK